MVRHLQELLHFFFIKNELRQIFYFVFNNFFKKEALSYEPFISGDVESNQVPRQIKINNTYSYYFQLFSNF